DFPERLRWGNLQLEFVEASTETAKFDLTFEVQQTSSGFVAHVEYNRDLFDQDTIERLLAHYENLLTGATRNPERPLSKLRLLSEDEAKQLLETWNDTATEYPRDKSIREIFQEQAART